MPDWLIGTYWLIGVFIAALMLIDGHCNARHGPPDAMTLVAVSLLWLVLIVFILALAVWVRLDERDKA